MEDEEVVTFPAGGGITLEGLLSRPAQPAQTSAQSSARSSAKSSAKTGIVVCHPHPLYGGEMRNHVVSALVDGFRRAGFATLRFNFRGVGASTGTHDDGNGEVDDVKAAVTYLLARQSVATLAVAGYSFGSWVGLRAGSLDPRVHKLIGVALPIASRDGTFLEGVTKPKLLISGDRDHISPLDKLQRLHAKLAEPKALTIVAGADHFFGGDGDAVAAAATAFLAR